MPKANWGSGAAGAASGAATGASIGSVIPGVGTAIGAGVGGLIGGVGGLWGGGSASRALKGTSATRNNVSTLRPEQEQLYNQAINAGMGTGAGGAFGTSADYYRGLLSDNSAGFQAQSAPMMNQYNQDIMPGISEQFAGMGAGGLSSSGFRNAQVQGGVDLSERLGALRSQLRQQGAQGLQGIGQMGLQNYSQNMETQPGSEGFLSQMAPAIGNAAMQFAGNYFSGQQGGTGGGGGNNVGANTSPYQGGGGAASPNLARNQGFNTPSFRGR